MYLSKLEIIGFKSFATKTALGFDSGISAIVGPNGCGKTNIVDAIRWVLGEQRYSALRSEKMEDVIFNGTKGRKPLGMAEASLVIENTRGVLPSEYTQVTIGRRVYRSGESEYLLNKVPCRLKDIQTLFMDTGMGADAYSVIELKMVESILSDKTDERRHLFEEAAGVTKYKHRRKAAYRKLENVQADLVRVNDIVSEIQKAVGTLERQAKRAEQYNEVRDQLRGMEIDLMEREFAQLHHRQMPLIERLEGLKGERVQIDGTLQQDEERLETLRSGMAEEEQRLAEAQRDVTNQRERLGVVRQRSLVASERRKGLEDTITRCRDQMASLSGEAQGLEEGREFLIVRSDQCRIGEEQAAKDLVEARTVLSVLESKLFEKRNELQVLSDRTIMMVESIAGQQSEQDKKRSRVENLQGRFSRAEEEIAAYEIEIVRLEGEIGRLREEDKRLRRLFVDAEVRASDAERQREEIGRQKDIVRTNELEIRGDLQRSDARREFLEGLLETSEGLPEGVRFLMSREPGDKGKLVTVGDVAVADPALRPALHAALGAFGDMLVVESHHEALRSIAELRKAGKGKAGFVSLDRIPEVKRSGTVSRIEGVRGWASDLMTCNDRYRAMFHFILDRILIVQTGAAAVEVMKRMAGITCVTLDGEVIAGSGLARGGSAGKNEGGSLGKQAQIEQLTRETEDLRVQADGMKKVQDDLQLQTDRIDLKGLQEEVKRVEKEMNGVEVRMAQLEFEKKRAGDVILKNREEMERLETESTELQQEMAGHAPDLDRLKAEKGEIERRVGSLQLETELLEREWNDRSKSVGEVSVREATLRGDHQNAVNDLARSDQRLRDISAGIEGLNADIRSAGEQIEVTDASMIDTGKDAEALEAGLISIEERRAEIARHVAADREEIHAIEMRIKDDRRSHDDSMTAMHDLELRIADLKAKTDHISARAEEEFEIQLTLKEYPADEFVDFASLRDQIQRLRDKIKSLGNINFAAFEEYNSEKERFEFLSAQRKDLLEAEQTLLSTIEEINTTAQRKFLDTFSQIRVNFIETFKSLFDPGDECDLRLEEEVDPLEARIEIIAKPRGKRPTSIDLLSGGEKTLTATALLFAIYLVKPSPFCILDEVDAPLDDANIDRFTRILRKFSNNTQFIVVTHNKRTMEAANALYGVTMEEEGVSKLVTVRFNQTGVRSAALISG